MIGVVLVFWEIWATQRTLSKRTWTQALADAMTVPVKQIRSWLRALRKPQASIVPLEANVSMSGDLKADLTIAEPDDASVKHRLDVLRRRLNAIDERLKEIGAEVVQAQTSLGDRINAAMGEATEETERLREVVDQLGAGSLGVRALGGILVFIGSALWVASEWL